MRRLRTFRLRATRLLVDFPFLKHALKSFYCARAIIQQPLASGASQQGDEHTVEGHRVALLVSFDHERGEVHSSGLQRATDVSRGFVYF